MRGTFLLLAALALPAVPAGAQARYRAQPDTLYYEALNPYRMYFVVRGDTVGDPVRSLEVERHVWRDTPRGLTAEVRTEPADGSREPRTDLLEVTPRGRVTAIRQGETGFRGRWDLVLRLPADGGLRPGRVWHDTLDVRDGENAFQAWRELRVERIADTLGSRVAIVRGTGRVRYRDAYPASGGKEWWIDVSGPARETFLFDLRNGRLAGREWWMDLRGTAAFPGRRGGMDTVPAGLFSTDTTRMITAGQARALTAGRTTRTPPSHHHTITPSHHHTITPSHHHTITPSPRPLSLLRGDHSGPKVAYMARSSCESAGRALLYRLHAVLTHTLMPPGGRDGRIRMPPRKDDASVETLREAARTFMDATSLRQAARDIGMSPTGLRGFLDGAAPYVKTERKLRAWYLREAQRQVQAVSPEAANNALRLLVGHFAPAYARETTLELVDVLERRCIDSQTPVPAWIAEVRRWYSE